MAQPDLPSVTLVQQSNAQPKTGEELEVLGKQAANMYLCSETDLTDAVIETVKKAGLSPEQVKRVVEFANTHAFLQEFKKEGADHKVIEFPGGPADASVILKDLNDGGGGTVFDRGDGDYNVPPQDTAKTASANMDRLGVEDRRLAEVFGVTQPNIPYAEPLQDSWELRQKVAGAYDMLTSELSTLETCFMDVCDNLYNEVKTAAMAGTPLGHIVAAWERSTENPEQVKAAFQMLTPRLLDNGVFPNREAMGNSLEMYKVAGAVNVEHPLVQHYNDFGELIIKMAQLREARDELASSADTLNTFLKHATEKVSVSQLAAQLGKGVGLTGKAVKGAVEGAAKLAPEVEAALGGGTLGKAVGAGVKYSPHAAGALAAEEAHQRIKHSPVTGGVRRFITERIPYTQANLHRQYRLQQGGF